MSMTYYAVTDDPNELAHYGILGMKWGVRNDKPRHTGSKRPRSAAYKKAQSKLSKAMQNGIAKAKSNWKAYNSPQAKEKRFMDKAIQKARNGTLKYGKLTDEQVQRVTDRLYLERQARQLGSTENPSFGKRIRTSIGEGVVRGVGMGTASYIDARMRGRGETTAAIKKDKRMARYEGRDDVQRRKARNKQTEEFYKTAYEEGDNPEHYKYAYSSRNRAKYLSEVKERNRLSDIRKTAEESYAKTYYTNLAKSNGEHDAKRLQEKSDRPFTWSNSNRSTPKLTSGSDSNQNKYPVTSSTYRTPKTSDVDSMFIVDSKGHVVYGKRRGKK